MLIWMLYVVVVTVFLSAAALCAERASRFRKGKTRWIWLVSIIASLLVPVLISAVAIQVPSVVSPTTIDRVIPLNTVTSSALSPARWIAPTESAVSALRPLDPTLRGAWITMSILLGVALIASGLLLQRRKRSWKQTTLGGVDVLVSRSAGPAVVGLVRPKIVVPEWITQSSASQQAVVIAHEQSHLDAGDQKLLTIALGLLVFMPWNLPIWWQLRRLRRAIEVDCDARVLSQGHGADTYGAALLEVGQQQSAFIGAVAAMSESVSFLEQRIRMMTSSPRRFWKVSATAFAMLAVGFVAVAAQVSPPNAELGDQEVSLSPAVLDRYVGYYQFGPNAVLTVTRDANQLSAQLTGQTAAEIYAKSEISFFYKIVDASIDFIVQGESPATALVLHQHGVEQRAERIDQATAEQIDLALNTRVQAQVPSPGTEAALRKLITGLANGTPNYSDMSPALAKVTRQQLPQLQPALAAMGPIQSMEFRSVGNQGWDVYEVRYERGVMEWRITLDDDGAVAGALVQAGP